MINWCFDGCYFLKKFYLTVFCILVVFKFFDWFSLDSSKCFTFMVTIWDHPIKVSWLYQVGTWTNIVLYVPQLPFWRDKGEEFMSWPREWLCYVIKKKFCVHQLRGKAQKVVLDSLQASWKVVLDSLQAYLNREYNI